MFNTALMRSRSFVLLLLVLLLASTETWADHHETLTLKDDTDIDILHIGDHPTDTAVIWFACTQGDETSEYVAARHMAAEGFQVFFPDMLSAHFLSPTPSNIASVPTDEIQQVVSYIIDHSDAQKVYLVGGARAAIPVINALAHPSIKSQNDKLKGALLITPRITRKNPQPGEEPEYIHAAGQSVHPIRVLEGERTPNRWSLNYLTQVLSTSGSAVSSELIKGVRGFFYLRSEQTPVEKNLTDNLHTLVVNHLNHIGASYHE